MRLRTCKRCGSNTGREHTVVKVRISPLVFVFVVVMAAFGAGFTLVGYGVAVVMHEMAHAEVARRRGYVLDKIKIMPFGASLTGAFEGASPKDECKIALAGPVCNVCVAALCVALWWLVPATYFFTEAFVLANVFTALTNVLPVFPLDGGRALLALLSVKVPRQKAYRVLRIFGWAVTLGFTALFAFSLRYAVNFTFALMALFVLWGTVFPDKSSRYQRLYGMAYRSEKLKHGLAVREVMVSDTLTLKSLEGMRNGNYYHRFTVVNAQLKEVAHITETELEDLLVRFSPQTRLSNLYK